MIPTTATLSAQLDAQRRRLDDLCELVLAQSGAMARTLARLDELRALGDCVTQFVALVPDLTAGVRKLAEAGQAPHVEQLLDWVSRAKAAEAECERLRGIVEGLAARVAGQSELLSKRAEGP